MTMFDNILNVLLPDYPTHSVFEFANRFKSQHILGFVLALCTVGFNPYVAQAGMDREFTAQLRSCRRILEQQYS